MSSTFVGMYRPRGENTKMKTYENLVKIPQLINSLKILSIKECFFNESKNINSQNVDFSDK